LKRPTRRLRAPGHVGLIDDIKASAPYLLHVTSRLVATSHWNTVRWTSIHPAESYVLLELWRDQPLSHSELSQRLRVNHASVGQTLRRLEANGFVERTPSPQDGRVVMVRSTKKGSALRDEVLGAAADLAKDIRSVLGQKDTDQLRRILNILATHYLAKE
jgi:DNA-binding MarR family transcriptional regulator